MCRGPKAAQPGDNVSVNLSGVSLPRHDEAARESSLGGYQLVKTLDFPVVTIKQLEEGGREEVTTFISRVSVLIRLRNLCLYKKKVFLLLYK